MKTMAIIVSVLLSVSGSIVIGQTKQISISDDGKSRTSQGHKILSARDTVILELKLMLDRSGPLPNRPIPLLCRMGDGAAVELTKILKTHGPLADAQRDRLVEVIRRSFEVPDAITQPQNRTPTASIALLGSLVTQTTDFAFRSRVEDAEQFILDATATVR